MKKKLKELAFKQGITQTTLRMIDSLEEMIDNNFNKVSLLADFVIEANKFDAILTELRILDNPQFRKLVARKIKNEYKRVNSTESH